MAGRVKHEIRIRGCDQILRAIAIHSNNLLSMMHRTYQRGTSGFHILFALWFDHVKIGVVKLLIKAALKILGDNGVFILFAFVQK